VVHITHSTQHRTQNDTATWSRSVRIPLLSCYINYAGMMIIIIKSHVHVTHFAKNRLIRGRIGTRQTLMGYGSWEPPKIYRH